MVLEYRRSLSLRGKVWVVHDVDADHGAPGGASALQAPPSPSHIPSHRGSAGSSPEFSEVLERGSLEPVGEFVAIDYQHFESLRQVPDGAADLVTMHQGLHHLPQAEIEPFLRDVHRMLRPAGLFIVREHDASLGLIPMLDMAHSIFNAVTGVSAADERGEIRAFRPVLEWRAIIESVGFVDTMVYEIEKGDPTVDEMMCFVKQSDGPSAPPPPLPLHSTDHAVPLSSVPPQLALAVDQSPLALLDLLRNVQSSLTTALPQLEQYALGRLDGLSGKQAELLTPQRVRGFFSPLKSVVARFGPVLQHVQARSDLASRLPLEEVFLLLRSLYLKGERGEGTPTEMMAIAAFKEVQAALGAGDTAASPAGDKLPAVLVQPSSSTDEPALGHGVPQRHEPAVAYNLEGVDETSSQDDVEVSAVNALLRRLLDAKPELARHDLLDVAGFPPRAQVAIQAKLSGVGTEAVSRSLALLLDAQAGP